MKKKSKKIRMRIKGWFRPKVDINKIGLGSIAGWSLYVWKDKSTSWLDQNKVEVVITYERSN